MTPSEGPDEILRVDDLSVEYRLPGRNRRLMAVRDVTLGVRRGETLGLIGESGSGKTTLGRAMLRRVDLAAGRVTFDGRDITHLSRRRMRPLRREMQMVFQDPYGSLNPRRTVLDTVAEPLIIHGICRNRNEARPRVRELLELTGLPADAEERYPHVFSGGQRQRIGIARALASRPKFVLVDEPVAALDTSIQAQIVNLLQDLQSELGLSYVFIGHDLTVVRHISDRIAIMYSGAIVEMGSKEAIFSAPAHPYTKALLSAVPVIQPGVRRERLVLHGGRPAAGMQIVGCAFASRCPVVRPGLCDVVDPLPRRGAGGQTVACHLVEGPPASGALGDRALASPDLGSPLPSSIP